MAARNVVEDDQEHLQDGHLTHYSWHQPLFDPQLPYHFERILIFNCKQAPTRWSFRVTFQQPASSNNVNVTIFIIRNDSNPTIVDVNFGMKASPSAPIEDGLAPDIDPQSFDWLRVSPQDRENQIFEDYIPIQILKAQAWKPIWMQVTFHVRGCHGDRIEV